MMAICVGPNHGLASDRLTVYMVRRLTYIG
jgi:hypothetical protein